MSLENSPARKGASGAVADDLLGDALTIAELMRTYRLSRSAIYKEIRSGRLKVMKVGRRTLVTTRARRAWEDACSQLPICHPIGKKPRATDAE